MEHALLDTGEVDGRAPLTGDAKRQRIIAVPDQVQDRVICIARLPVHILRLLVFEFPVCARKLRQHVADWIAETDAAEGRRVLRGGIDKLVVYRFSAPGHFHQLRFAAAAVPEAIGDVLIVHQDAVLVLGERPRDRFDLRLRHAGLHTVGAGQLPGLQGLGRVIGPVVVKQLRLVLHRSFLPGGRLRGRIRGRVGLPCRFGQSDLPRFLPRQLGKGAAGRGQDEDQGQNDAQDARALLFREEQNALFDRRPGKAQGCTPARGLGQDRPCVGNALAVEEPRGDGLVARQLGIALGDDRGEPDQWVPPVRDHSGRPAE